MRRYIGLLLFVIACASGSGGASRLPLAVTAGPQAQKCSERNASGCTILLVDNGTSIEDAEIYLYGGRLGIATGGKTTPFYIPNGMLHQGGVCAVISAYHRLSNVAWTSREECGRAGGYFALTISAPFSTTSLVPW